LIGENRYLKFNETRKPKIKQENQDEKNGGKKNEYVEFNNF